MFRTIYLSLLILLISFAPLRAEAPATQPVGILAMGDWGQGTKDQKDVAGALAKYATDAAVKPSAFLLAGDNFYVKLNGIDDPQWQSLFEQMYDPKALDMPFYAALGNHDYLDGKADIELAYAKAHPESRWKLPSNYYRVDLPANNPLVTVVILDSNKDSLSKDDWQKQIDWLDAELSKPRQTIWTICCAHHPLYSNGTHGDNGQLIKFWGPIFDKHKVDFYLCGHDHDLQHLQVPDHFPSFVLAGGGGAKTTAMLYATRGPFSKSMFGFADFQFTPDQAIVRYIDKNDNVVHAFSRTKAGEVKILQAGESDPATTHPRRTIQELPEPATAPN